MAYYEDKIEHLDGALVLFKRNLAIAVPNSKKHRKRKWYMRLKIAGRKGYITRSTNAPASSPENFPCVITSRSLRNLRSGILDRKRTNLQVKIDVVEREIEMLMRDEVDELALLAKRVAVGRNVSKLVLTNF